MSRQEDFDTQSDKYVEMRKSFGVNDPYSLKEIGEAHYQGAEYAYQYAIEKGWKLIEKLCDSHNIVSIKDGKYKSRSWLEEQFRKAMQ